VFYQYFVILPRNLHTKTGYVCLQIAIIVNHIYLCVSLVGVRTRQMVYFTV